MTLLLPNPQACSRWRADQSPECSAYACRSSTGFLQPLCGVATPVVQSSANPSGGADARRLDDVDPAIRAGVDIELDGGALPGTPSTVIDLTGFETGEFRILREGAMAADIAESLLHH